MDASRRLCAMRIGGWAPQELHDHEHEEVARDLAEGVRLAYVAATRARDLLVVPALGDEPWEGGWFGPLNRALYPPIDARRTARRGPRCPAFRSKDSGARAAERRTGRRRHGVSWRARVSPSGYSVVWWDPHELELGQKPAFGVRREELIVKDVPTARRRRRPDGVRPLAAGAGRRARGGCGGVGEAPDRPRVGGRCGVGPDAVDPASVRSSMPHGTSR